MHIHIAEEHFSMCTMHVLWCYADAAIA